jgi:2-polyprenyl-3-methyl-5-hydroxy-6-metoxy-1,4-benzoquinol methylase
MAQNQSEFLEKIRQQFDTAPYPADPLEHFSNTDLPLLYVHSLVTSYYLRNQKFTETEGKVILDAGCGTGYKSLLLAYANPEAKIIGIDLSEESIKLAKQRLQYHDFKNVEFQAISIEDLHPLSLKFDYINCDEVLYLLPDPSGCLKAMKSVLKPDGIIRVNLHSSLQRAPLFQSQEVFNQMGLMDQNPSEVEIELVIEIMKALKNNVWAKMLTWRPSYEEDKWLILRNYLLQGDKGYTIPEMFSVLKAAELEFISMVNWGRWNLMDLFNEPDNLPGILEKKLSEISVEERLYLFELLQPRHRLLDFWCGHPNQAQAFVAVADWTVSAWQKAKVHLHPQLKTSAIKEELTRCVSQLQPLELTQLLPISDKIATLDSTIAACLLRLWENAELVSSLVEYWRKLRPVNPFSLKPTTQEEAFEIVKQTLLKLTEIGYVLLEH